MPRINVRSVVGAMRDVRPCADPWGLGLVWDISRMDTEEFSKEEEELQVNTDLARNLVAATSRAAMVSAGKRQRGAKVDIEALYDQEITKAAETLVVDPKMTLESRQKQRALRAKLVKGWDRGPVLDDETGEPLEFSEELVCEIFSDPRKWPFAIARDDRGNRIFEIHGHPFPLLTEEELEERRKQKGLADDDESRDPEVVITEAGKVTLWRDAGGALRCDRDDVELVEIEFGGHTLGAAMQAWVVSEAAKNQAYRVEETSVREGNFDAPSTGISESGAA